MKIKSNFAKRKYSRMFLKSDRNRLKMFLHYLLLLATLTLSAKATQPLLSGNFISESHTSFEFRDFTLLPFSTETRDFSPTRLVISIDKNKIFPPPSFEDLADTVARHLFLQIPVFYFSSYLIPILDRNCILRI